MKKYIFAAAVTTILIIVGWLALDRANLFAVKGMIIEGLVGDVSNFYGEKSRLPLNWEEFATWAKDAHTARQWTSEELNSRFALKWGARITSGSSQPDKIFVVLDPRFKEIEPVANQQLYERCSIFNRDTTLQK